MLRSLLVAAPLLAILPAVPAAPVPRHLFPQPPAYFPTRVGDRWVMEYETSGEDTPPYVVTAVEDAGRAKVVTVGRELRFDKVLPEGKYWVAGCGVYQLEAEG